MKPRNLSLPMFVALVWVAMFPSTVRAQNLVAGVCSSFKPTLEKIAESFFEKQGVKVDLVSGSTGSLFAQIKNGAPYDLFFAADKLRPTLLEKEGLVLSGSHRCYVQGQLVLIGTVEMDDIPVKTLIQRNPETRIAIANPKTAPFGKAAEETLKGLNLWEVNEDRILLAGNANKVVNLFQTGNADWGFCALSQALETGSPFYKEIPTSLYQPIFQDVVVLKRSKLAPEALKFLEFLKTEGIKKYLLKSGYKLPEED